MASREQPIARGVAERAGGVGVGEPQALTREAIDVRCGDFGLRLVAARIAVAHVIDENQEDVGRRGGAWRHGGKRRRCEQQEKTGAEESAGIHREMIMRCDGSTGSRCGPVTGQVGVGRAHGAGCGRRRAGHELHRSFVALERGVKLAGAGAEARDDLGVLRGDVVFFADVGLEIVELGRGEEAVLVVEAGGIVVPPETPGPGRGARVNGEKKFPFSIAHGLWLVAEVVVERPGGDADSGRDVAVRRDFVAMH